MYRLLAAGLTAVLTAAAVLAMPVAAPALASATSGSATSGSAASGSAASGSAASAGDGGDGWVPAPSEPWDMPAGARCDFPIHAEPIVDEVRMRVLETYPDGSSKREAYVGDLVMEVTNTDTGASTEVDASGIGLVDYRPGGSFTRDSTWLALGPALFGFAEGGGNRPRGVWRFDGVYQIVFSETGYKTVTMYYGTETNVCALIS